MDHPAVSSTQPFADAAMALAERGLAVIPCPGDVGKSPRGAIRGFHRWKRPPGGILIDQSFAHCMLKDRPDHAKRPGGNAAAASCKAAAPSLLPLFPGFELRLCSRRPTRGNVGLHFLEVMDGKLAHPAGHVA